MPNEILMPALSPTMEEGTLAKWLVKPGDAVKPGDVIAEIETDKATMEVEAVDEGVVAEILVAAGTEHVKVNTPIARLDGEGAAPAPVTAKTETAPKAEPAPKAEAAPNAPPPAQAPAKSTNGGTPPAAAADGGRVFASPLARRMAAQAGIDLATLRGSGPNGRIVKADIEAAAGRKPMAPAAAPQPPVATAPAPASAAGGLPDSRLFFAEGSYTDVPHDSIRRTIAKRLTSAKRDIPHYYLTVECEIDALLKLRAELNAKSPKDGPGAYKISVNDFVVRASAIALMRVPTVNSSWTETSLLRHAHADIGFAVSLGEAGLITPIITAAETKGLATIAREAADLAARARDKKLKPTEFEGGTFSISNLGMFGIKDFTAVINPPHAAILAVGAGEQRPMVKNGALAIATVMTVRLSCDHRVIDGSVGATWLQVFKGLIEDPVTMLL